MALIFSASLFQEGTALSAATQTPVALTPTPDRLAEPTLPAAPSQADYGAQVYWLNCSACHGDVGQGLTDEFRKQYPPEDQYCWNSGCHGKRPYENGFTIPTLVPAVIGAHALDKFPNASVLHAYIRAAMPFWKPGSLTDDEYWQITAFLLRQSGFWDGNVELDESNAAQVTIHVPPTPTPQSGLANLIAQPVSLAVIAGFIFLAILLWILARAFLRSRKL